ncbi:MAG: MBL fold metallo-hydrolase, partial [Chitinophagaceae bacterium]
MKSAIFLFSIFFTLQIPAQILIGSKIEISSSLVLTKLSNHVYIHTSSLQTQDFGNVPCNGMVVIDNNEAIIFDTPTNDSLSAKLIHYIEHHLNSKIIAIIPTHFHKDCLGGLKKFHQMNIPSYAYLKTIIIAKDKQIQIPQYSFDSILRLLVGKEEIYAQFVGEGHSEDNIIGYFPKEKILFGGCLVKELG